MSIGEWDKALYPNIHDREPARLLVEKIAPRIQQNSIVLDVGAGGGHRTVYDFRGKCKEMIGIDLDSKVTDNPLLDRGILSDGHSIPLPDQSVDLAFSIYVLEHVQDPKTFCAEVHRVLRPGGEFWAITPNRFHYVPLVASLTPTKFHKWFNRKRGRQDDDTFSTYYRLNSRRSLKDHFTRAGMDPVEITAIEVRPNYLEFSSLLFLMGMIYERTVNSSSLFEGFRVNYIAGFKRP